MGEFKPNETAHVLGKFCPLFQKWRVWAEPTQTPFLFDNFFFAASSVKEKVAMEVEKLVVALF